MVSEEWVSAGQTVAGKYRLESRLGRGGMGEVWRAEHLVLRAPVAVKFINPSLAVSGGDATSRFLREAQAAAALRSVHVVQILDYGVDQHVPFMVLEYLEGESLSAHLSRHVRLSPGETAHIMTHVGRAMQRAHDAGIVHRDLKPENVFLVPTGDELIAKVLDFGIAKMQNPGAMLQEGTRTGAIMGTPYYMSPEQVEGNKAIDYRSDIWAMGVIAYECLTGKRPFDSDSFGDLVLRICMHPMPRPSAVAQVPAGFDEWFARAVNRNVSERFGSAKEAAATLRQICTGLPGNTWESSGSVGLPATMQLGQQRPVTDPVSADTAKPFSTTNRGAGASTPPKRKTGAAVAVALAIGATAALAVGGILAVRTLGQPAATPEAPATAPPEAPPAPTAEPPIAAPTPPEAPAAPTEASAVPAPSASATNKPATTPRPVAKGGPRPDKPAPTAAPRPTTAPATRPDDLL